MSCRRFPEHSGDRKRTGLQHIEELERAPDATWHEALHERATITDADWNTVVTHRPAPKVDVVQQSPLLLQPSPAPTDVRESPVTHWLYSFVLQLPSAGGAQPPAEQPALGILFKQRLPKLEPFEVFLDGESGREGPGACTLTCSGETPLSAGVLALTNAASTVSYTHLTLPTKRIV